MSDYGFEHNGQVYTPNGTTGVSVAENEQRNRAIEQAELADWRMRPSHVLAYYTFPADRAHSFEKTPHFPYRCNVCKRERGLSPELCNQSRVYRRDYYPELTGAQVTTWRGQLLGHIVSAKVYRHNFGSRMVALTVRGTNGAVYHGRANWDHGSCIRLHRSK